MLNRILNYSIMNLAKSFSESNIIKYMKPDGRKISKDTVLDYLLYSTNAFFMFQTSKEDFKGNKLIIE